MTASQVAPPTPHEEATPHRRRRPLVVAVIVLVAVGGLVAGIVLAGRSGSGITAAQAAQLRTLQSACTQWVGTTGDQSVPPANWCHDMVQWMTDRAEDHPGMWVSLDDMRATCEQWSASAPSGSGNETNPTAWCNGMVSWMQQSATRSGSSWNGWMMHGPMMG